MQVAVRLRQSEKLGRVTVPPTVALLRYAYDQEAKRARQERVGTVPFWTDELPSDIKEKLTPDELQDWRNFVRDRNHQQEMALWRFHLQQLPRSLAYASKALGSGEIPEDVQRIWWGIDVLTDALEKVGIERVKRERGRPRKEAMVDANYLLLQTEEERERWWKSIESDIADLPYFGPMTPAGQPKPRFPEYPEGDLIARALKLAFVEGDGN